MDAIRGAGFDVHQAAGIGEVGQRASDLAAAGQLRAAVAVGGDGTFGALLNQTPVGTPLTIVPVGTENLMAKYLGLRGEPRGVVDLLQRGVVAGLDAGLAGGRLFALMISAGLDAEVVRQVHRRRSGNITHLAYAGPILRAVCTYRYPPITANWQDAGGQPRQATSCWMFGVNLPRYAKNLPIAPAASGLDGLLDVSLFRRPGTAAGLGYLWSILRRRQERLPSVTATRCQRLRLESPQPDVAYQLDGDPGGVLPVEVSVAPARLSVVLGRAAAARLGFAVPAV